MIRRSIVTVSLALAFTTGAWTANAQNQERHPVLHRAIEQINNIKMRLQSAPNDFGGHKQKAIEALGIAASELQEALQFDKK